MAPALRQNLDGLRRMDWHNQTIIGTTTLSPIAHDCIGFVAMPFVIPTLPKAFAIQMK
jgi:hypothetical protein